MDPDQLEVALAQLDQAETCVFRLVEAEPDLIRQPEILAVLMHLKSAITALQGAGERAKLRSGSQYTQGSGQKA
jgi:hypothetical protein